MSQTERIAHTTPVSSVIHVVRMQRETGCNGYLQRVSYWGLLPRKNRLGEFSEMVRVYSEKLLVEKLGCLCVHF